MPLVAMDFVFPKEIGVAIDENALCRELKERHINLMALGSTIGVGLFLGSATAIHLAGPAVLLCYIVGGAAIFMIMRALGEMAVHNPVAGSFSRYAGDYIGDLAGYLTGWTYWLLWLATCLAEITAIGVYMQFWFPGSPQWVWALGAALLMTGANLFVVKAFGEFEFWFALVKIVTVVLMVLMSLGMIIFGIGNHGAPVGLSNLWSQGGFMPHGWTGILFAMQMVMYAYLGIEMLGLTAGEAKNPGKTLSRAVNSVFWRILIFYVGALFVILSIYPWNEIGREGSPFVKTFEHMGIMRAAGIINFVVITAALSSCNGGIFSIARMLYTLAEQKKAPAAFSRLSKHGVPVAAVMVSGVVMHLGVIMNYMAPKEIFVWMTSIATFAALWTWLIILVAQLCFRKGMPQNERGRLLFKMPFWPWGSLATIAFIFGVAALMAYDKDTRIALTVGPIWLAFLTTVYYGAGLHRQPVTSTPHEDAANTLIR